MFKALTSFSGAISMSRGETRAINDENIIKDLLKAGYIENIENISSEKIKSKPKRTRRRKTTNED